MAAYILVDITINDPQTYERYKLLAPASIAPPRPKCSWWRGFPGHESV